VAAARALGDQYLQDVLTLRAGEDWDQRLMELIAEADVFQLFWSSNSMVSRNCRREWERALDLGRQSFVRPVYWEDPLPQAPHLDLPPQTLRELHFAKVPALSVAAAPRRLAAGRASVADLEPSSNGRHASVEDASVDRASAGPASVGRASAGRASVERRRMDDVIAAAASDSAEPPYGLRAPESNGYGGAAAADSDPYRSGQYDHPFPRLPQQSDPWPYEEPESGRHSEPGYGRPARGRSSGWGGPEPTDDPTEWRDHQWLEEPPRRRAHEPMPGPAGVGSAPAGPSGSPPQIGAARQQFNYQQFNYGGPGLGRGDYPGGGRRKLSPLKVAGLIVFLAAFVGILVVVLAGPLGGTTKALAVAGLAAIWGTVAVVIVRRHRPRP
jgi:hypothetical protein